MSKRFSDDEVRAKLQLLCAWDDPLADMLQSMLEERGKATRILDQYFEPCSQCDGGLPTMCTCLKADDALDQLRAALAGQKGAGR